MCVYLVVKLIERERGVCLRTYYVERVTEREREGGTDRVLIFSHRKTQRERE